MISRKKQRAANRQLRNTSLLSTMSMPDLLTRRTDLGSFQNVLGAAVSEIGNSIEAVTEEIRTREGKMFEVSDHALIQYLRRVIGYDTEAVRHEIVELLSRAAPMETVKSDAKAYLAGGIIFVVARKGKVVTAYPAKQVEEIAPAVVDEAIQIQKVKP